MERRKTDILFRLKHNVRNRLWCAFNNKNWKKEGSVKLLGASYEVVIEHLESLFLEEMSWSNYGSCESYLRFWQIDHKIPLSSVDSKEDMEKLCHYTNLQPLWSFDNLSKGAKY